MPLRCPRGRSSFSLMGAPSTSTTWTIDLGSGRVRSCRSGRAWPLAADTRSLASRANPSHSHLEAPSYFPGLGSSRCAFRFSVAMAERHADFTSGRSRSRSAGPRTTRSSCPTGRSVSTIVASSPLHKGFRSETLGAPTAPGSTVFEFADIRFDRAPCSELAGPSCAWSAGAAATSKLPSWSLRRLRCFP